MPGRSRCLSDRSLCICAADDAELQPVGVAPTFTRAWRRLDLQQAIQDQEIGIVADVRAERQTETLDAITDN